jgi:hypothetical protein
MLAPASISSTGELIGSVTSNRSAASGSIRASCHGRTDIIANRITKAVIDSFKCRISKTNRRTVVPLRLELRSTSVHLVETRAGRAAGERDPARAARASHRHRTGALPRDSQEAPSDISLRFAEPGEENPRPQEWQDIAYGPGPQLLAGPWVENRAGLPTPGKSTPGPSSAQTHIARNWSGLPSF